MQVISMMQQAMPLHLGMVDYLTGRYNFRDQEGRIDFDMLIELLENKLRKSM